VAVKIGQRVLFIAVWSSFRGKRGHVHATDPLMVVMDDDPKPIRVGTREVIPLEYDSTKRLHTVAGE
jgi:hypothetical protein